MIKTMTAKFSGRCSRSGAPIKPGDDIHYDRRTGRATLAAPRADYVSDVIDFGNGRQYYRNKNGRCEDAPCCGCCTI